jgi:chitinase
MTTARLFQPTIVHASLAAAALSPALLIAAAPSTKLEKVFVGYAYHSPENIPYDLYTHLCHAFVTADAEGHLNPNRHVPSRPFVEASHSANVKVLLSLGGWGWDDEFAGIVADPAAEARYIDAVICLVDEFDYDGLDLDWEYPDKANEVTGFNRLVRMLRSRLDEVGQRKGRSMLLTMAASASPGTIKWLDRDVLLETMDWINVMTYDYVGPWSKFAGHHSPLYASSKAPPDGVASTELTMRYIVDEKELPPDRLAAGIPLYGKAFKASEPYAAVDLHDAGSLNYTRLHELQSAVGWRRLWDDETKSPWLIAPDASRVVGYDDPQSAELKTSWAGQQGFRGVFFWQIAGDLLPDGSNPVQQAAHRAWSQGDQRPR